ncbi:MAG: plasmid pRiA4b ORF-3 family protein [Pseudomonadota bacterium]|nr:plasmid pRiA4b ORF-3 family protein [Pseudomonadota bacterium]
MTKASAPSAPTPHPAYLLRIELRGFKPAIWRDVWVAPRITLPELHDVVQAAMGWENAHMHAFAQPLKNEGFWQAPPDRVYQPHMPFDFDGLGESEAKNEDGVALNTLLCAPKAKLLYMYDFGDDWEHVITLKSIDEVAEPLPWLVKAQNGCPPEDVGGPPGAAYWAEIWHDPSHPEHETAREIMGDDEPGTLHFDQLQAAVHALRPRPRKPARKRKPA